MLTYSINNTKKLDELEYNKNFICTQNENFNETKVKKILNQQSKPSGSSEMKVLTQYISRIIIVWAEWEITLLGHRVLTIRNLLKIEISWI